MAYHNRLGWSALTLGPPCAGTLCYFYHEACYHYHAQGSSSPLMHARCRTRLAVLSGLSFNMVKLTNAQVLTKPQHAFPPVMNPLEPDA
jgi:hypothetical protein